MTEKKTFGKNSLEQKKLECFVRLILGRVSRIETCLNSLRKKYRGSGGQCDQIGRFLNIFCIKISFKSSSNVSWLFRLFENIPFQVKTFVATFWATFEKLIFKLDEPQPLFVYFRSFQKNIITIIITDQREKMSCPSSERRQ